MTPSKGPAECPEDIFHFGIQVGRSRLERRRTLAGSLDVFHALVGELDGADESCQGEVSFRVTVQNNGLRLLSFLCCVQ